MSQFEQLLEELKASAALQRDKAETLYAQLADSLAEAIGKQQLSLEQALDLPEELMGEVQDAFLDGEGELPPVASLTEQFQGRASEGVLHCVRAALQAEFEV